MLEPLLIKSFARVYMSSTLPTFFLSSKFTQKQKEVRKERKQVKSKEKRTKNQKKSKNREFCGSQGLYGEKDLAP